MEKEILFTTSKWEILKEIAQSSQAPLGIAKKLNTTIANVSQQLRLLEAAGLVKKQRIANVGAGQPRALFSISKEFVYLTLVSNGLAEKKLIEPDFLQVIIAKTWLLENPLISNVLSKFFYCNETLCDSLNSIHYSSHTSNKIYLEIVLKKPSIKLEKSYFINFNGKEFEIILEEKEVFSKNSFLLYQKNLEVNDG